MKFSLILIVLVSSAVVLQAASIQHSEHAGLDSQKFDIPTEVAEFVASQKFGILTGIAQLVHQIVEGVKNSLDDFAAQTQDWIQNQISVIEDAIVSSADAFNEYIQEVQRQIDSLVNGQLRPCLDGITEKIENVRQETKAARDNCREEGWSMLLSIQEDVDNYRQVNQELFNGTLHYIAACANQPNIGDAIKCAVDASRNISRSVAIFRENLRETTIVISEKFRTAAAETHECISSANAEGKQRIRDILDEARQCLEDATSSTNVPSNEDTEAPNEPTEEPTAGSEAPNQGA